LITARLFVILCFLEMGFKPADLGKPVRVLLTGSSFVFFWSGGALLSWVVLPILSRRRMPKQEKKRHYQEWLQWGFRVFHDYMRLWGLTDYDPRKVALDLPDGPYVMITNHPTLVDVTAVMSAVGRPAIVVGNEWWKGEVSRLLELCGHIKGADGPLGAGSVAVQALERLAEGQPVLIFPEGTRSPKHGLHPFHRGAFEIARRAKVPIVPVFITADPAWLMKHQRWFQVPDRMNRMRVVNLPGVENEVPEDSSKELAERFRTLYQERLDAWLHEKRTSGMVRH